MELHEFFGKYANTPLNDRNTILQVGEQGLSLNQIFRELSALEDMRRQLVSREKELVDSTELYYKVLG